MEPSYNIEKGDCKKPPLVRRGLPLQILARTGVLFVPVGQATRAVWFCRTGVLFVPPRRTDVPPVPYQNRIKLLELNRAL